jgi:flagellar motor switch protein FliG
MPPSFATTSAATNDAAILMLMFGEATAAEVMRHLTPAEVQYLGAAMYAVEEVTEAEADRVLESFLSRLAGETGLGHGTNIYVRNVMHQALGPDRAQSVISRISPSSTERPIKLLEWMDARAISELISDEHPQIMALVISCLDYAQGAEVLTSLPEELQADIVRRIAELSSVTPEALRDLEQVLQREFKASTSSSASQIGGVRAAARIMNFTRSGAEARILRDIRKDDKDLMAAITVHDTVALRGDLDSILKILYHKDLRNVRTASRPST